MEPSLELLYLGIGIVVGLIIGGLAVFLIRGNNKNNQSGDAARQEYEKERVGLQSDLRYAGKTVEEKKSLITAQDRQIGEITHNLNESIGNLGIANERVQTLAESREKLTQQTEAQTNEINAVRNQLAQLNAQANAF